MSTLELVVRRTDEIADGVREIALERPDGGLLPAHPAGSHLIIDCGQRRNGYSLTNSGFNPAEYTIAVLKGGGGSTALHRLRSGDRLTATRPRSSFAPVSNARRHLLIAAGIGVTPLLAHARDAARWARDVRMIYLHKPGRGAFAAELETLLRDRISRFTARGLFFDELTAAVESQPLGTHLYVCGPARFTDAVLSRAKHVGWPGERLHTERFEPADLPPGRPFTASLARAGRSIEVPAGVSLLDAILVAGIELPNMCRQGVCGECEVRVVAGIVERRGEYPTEGGVLCCVDRAATQSLVLDL
jgi:ferredoxin-NADP reductase